MEDRVTLSQKGLRRWHLLKMVLEGHIGLGEAGERMGITYRQAKRLKRAAARDGPGGLVHGNRGRRTTNALDDDVRATILELSQTQYPSFNDTHFTQKLATAEGIRVSRETVRRIRREAGIAPKRRRRPPRHRARRQRKPQEGMMVIWDGSAHQWFGPQEAPCCLMAAVDDATGKCVAARFFPFECSVGYLWLLRTMVKFHGIPLSIYQDRHSALKRNDDNWTLQEQLRGEQDPTQVGWALRELAIQTRYALSPQAKGRIERLFGTLQDRLMAELERAGIREIEKANGFLETGYLKEFNEQFGRAPLNRMKAWRPRPPGLDIERICSLRYEATVGNDNAVRLGGMEIDIPPGRYRASYARARVEVRQLLDGSWRVYYQGTCIAKHQATELREPMKTIKRHKKKAKATHAYAWVYLASAQDPYP
jgi:transposase